MCQNNFEEPQDIVLVKQTFLHPSSSEASEHIYPPVLHIFQSKTLVSQRRMFTIFTKVICFTDLEA